MPDPQLELIFLLARGAAGRAASRERIHRLLARVDFDRLAAELSARRLLPLIGSRAVEVNPELCPAGFRAITETARAAARARGLAVEAETRRIAVRLAEGGIRALPLKGPLLAEAAHGDIGLRESGDVDVLIPRSHLDDAVRLLEADGFESPADPVRKNGLPDLHFAVHHRHRPSVELHWRVHWYEEAFSKRMLARARPTREGLLAADPEDLAVALLLFYARDGFHGVRLAADIASWWDRSGEALSPHFLENVPERFPEIAPALSAAATVVKQLSGTPAPEWLGSARSTGHRIGLAVRLLDWTQGGDRDQLAANISLVDGLLAPVAAIPAFVRRELVPRSGPATPHAVKMLARYGSALWRLRRGRRWEELPS